MFVFLKFFLDSFSLYFKHIARYAYFNKKLKFSQEKFFSHYKAIYRSSLKNRLLRLTIKK